MPCGRAAEIQYKYKSVLQDLHRFCRTLFLLYAMLLRLMKEVYPMIRIGIVGYGNLARGAESSIRQNPSAL